METKGGHGQEMKFKELYELTSEERATIVSKFLAFYKGEVSALERFRLRCWVESPDASVNSSGRYTALTPNQVFYVIRNHRLVAMNLLYFCEKFNCPKVTLSNLLKGNTWRIYDVLYSFYSQGYLE